MSDPFSYYSALNLSPSASSKEIKENFQKLSRVLHPDKQPENLRRAAATRWAKLEEAKEVLLNPNKRFAYDNYGKLGLEIYNSHSEKLDQYEIHSYSDQCVLNAKLRRIIKDTKEQELRSEFNPRSSATVSLSVSEFLDSMDQTYYKKGQVNWTPKLVLSSFQLQEFVKWNLNSRLAGDVGFVVQTQGGVGAGALAPRVSWVMGAGYVVQVGCQLSDKLSYSVNLSKSLESAMVSSSLVLKEGGPTAMVSLNKKLSDTLESRLDIGINNKPTADLYLTKKHGNHKVNTELELASEDLGLGVGYKYKFTKRIAFKAGAKLNGSNNYEGYSVGLSTELGVSMGLSENTKVYYMLETKDEELRLVPRFRRNSINLGIPISLSQNLSLKTYLIGLVSLGLGVFLTKKLSKYFHATEARDLREQYKTKKKQEAQLENRRLAHEYTMMVFAEAKQKAEEEKSKLGLVIEKGLYGSDQEIKKAREDQDTQEVVDVTAALQMMVENSGLFISNKSKSALEGFYSTCESPVLFIKYRSGGVVYYEKYRDDEVVLIP